MASFAPIRGTRAQIQATPIVDGQFLVETDQGVDNMIYMDEGSTRTIVGGNTVTGVLPELYIYSETGSTVTVEDEGGTLIPTSQVGTDHWICEVPDYGTYTVYSLLNGDTTTQSINVTDCMIYTIDDSHFHCNIVVTYPSGVGASCQISGGGETYSAPALNPPDTSYKFVVHGQNTTYTITTNANGAIRTETIATGTTLDQTFNVTIDYARVNLTVETPPITGNITCTDGITTFTVPVSSNIQLFIPNTGTWTISGSDGVDTYDETVYVNSLSDVISADLSSAPDGSTVTPTDDIQIWLQCAKIRNKLYTTLAEVIDDKETLQKLISSENAVNYMVRSKTFINAGLVPQMTSASAPSGNATANSSFSGYEAWKAFNTSESNGWGNWNTSTNHGYANNDYLTYEFPTAQVVKKVKYGWKFATTANDFTFKIQGSNDNFVSDINDLCDEQPNIGFVFANILSYKDIELNNDVAYKYYRLLIVSANNSNNIGYGIKLQYYPQYGEGITDNELAMRYIGEKNYAANTLLDDEDWLNGICASDYYANVFNVKVPVMTSNTTPSGVASANAAVSGKEAYKAFNGSGVSDRWETPSTGANNTPTWIEYMFPRDVKIYMFNMEVAAYGHNAYDLNIQYKNDSEVDYTNLKSYTNTDITSFSQVPLTPHIGNRFRCYFGKQPNYSGGWYTMVYELQFYGREDVDETVFNVYSAVSDTVSITGNGVSITCTTDPNGYGTVSKNNLPNGKYTFTSSQANDPDNISNYYSKEIEISNGIFDIAVMPDDVTYWYGYEGGNFEIISSDNGWTAYTGYSFNAPTKTTYYYDINFAGTSNKEGGISTKNVLLKGNSHRIAEGISGGGTPVTCGYNGSVYNKSMNVSWEQYYYIYQNKAKYSIYDEQNCYPTSSAASSARHYCYALYETTPKANANVFSAANDTITYNDGTNTGLFAITNDVGEAFVDMSQFLGKTLTLTSSVALDPANLSNYFSKSNVAITTLGDKVYLMPNGNILYWYGYVTNIGVNGYTYNNSASAKPNPNINSITTNKATSSSDCTVYGTIAPVDVTSYSNIKVIYKGVTSAGGDYGLWGYSTNKNETFDNSSGLGMTSATVALLTNSSITSVTGYKYIKEMNNNGRGNSEVYAVWLD